MKNKFIKNSLSVALMVSFLPINALADFNSPFDDREEKPLLFADDGSAGVKPMVRLPEPSPIDQKLLKKSVGPVENSSVVIPQKTIESELTVSKNFSDIEKERDRLAVIKKESEEANRIAKQRQAEAKELEAAIAERAEQQRKEALKRQQEQERIEREKREKIRVEELNKALLEKQRIEAEFKEKQRLENERKKQEEAERLAKIKAEEAAKAQAREEARQKAIADRKAELERKKQEEAERLAKIKAEAKRVAEEAEAKRVAAAEKRAKELAFQAELDRKAKEEATKLEAERKAKEAAIKAEAERIASERIAKAEADRKVKEEAAIQAEVNRLLMEKTAKAEAERKAQELAAKVEADRLMAEKSAKAELSRKAKESSASQIGTIPKQPLVGSLTSGQTYANRATQSALQKATSRIAIDPSKMPLRNRVLGFTASKDQIKALNDRYQYNSERMSIMPSEVGEIKLLPTVRLTGDSIALFASQKDKQIVEEYLSYNPLHSQVFSNYVARILTMNNGQTGGVSVDKALMEELTYNFATTPIKSSTLKEAQDQYLYITSRLTNEDQIKFWNWVNTVKTGDEIKVPTWIGLSDVMYSQ